MSIKVKEERELLSREEMLETLDKGMTELREWLLDDGQKGKLSAYTLIYVRHLELPSVIGDELPVLARTRCQATGLEDAHVLRANIDQLLRIVRAMMQREKQLEGKPPVMSLEDVSMVLDLLNGKKPVELPSEKWN